MATTNDGTIDVSQGAQAAAKRAMASLQPYKTEPRVAALIGKLNAIVSPENFDGDEDAMSKALEDVIKIEKSDPEEVAESLRERAGVVRLDLERALLRKHSPAGSEAWEAAARAAGHAH